MPLLRREEGRKRSPAGRAALQRPAAREDEGGVRARPDEGDGRRDRRGAQPGRHRRRHTLGKGHGCSALPRLLPAESVPRQVQDEVCACEQSKKCFCIIITIIF